jgi:hypothetical protein
MDTTMTQSMPLYRVTEEYFNTSSFGQATGRCVHLPRVRYGYVWREATTRAEAVAYANEFVKNWTTVRLIVSVRVGQRFKTVWQRDTTQAAPM